MKTTKTIAKIFGWTLAALLAIVLLILLLSQTKPVKNKIVQVAQTEVNKSLKAKLHVESIDGNFLNGLGLNNVFLEYENDTIAFIPNLKLKYKLMPLLKASILVNSVEIDDPIFYVTQYTDSTWNFQNIVKPNVNPDTVAKPFSMKLNIENVKINNGNVFVNALDTIIPRQVRNLNSDFSFQFSQNEQEVLMRELRFDALKPDLSLKNLSFHLHRDSNYIRLKDFALQTRQNNIQADVKFDPKNLSNSFANVSADSIRAEEFQFLIPSLKIPANPKLELKTAFNKENSTLDLMLKDKNQLIDLQVNSENLVDFIQKETEEPLKYQLTGNFENINVKDWLDDPAMDYKLTGNLTADAEGTNPKTMKAFVKGDFKDMSLLKRQVSSLNFDLDYNAGDVIGKVDGAGSFGKVHLIPNVKNIWAERPSYVVAINTKQLDLSKILLDNELKSSLTMNGNIRGQGWNPKTMNAAFNGTLTNARMYDFSVDKMNMALDYQRGDVRGNVTGWGDFGKLYIEPNIRQVLSKSPSYTARVTTENLNLASLLSNDSLASDLNLTFDVAGRGFNPKQMTADASLVAFPSSIMGVNIQQVISDVRFSNNNLDINSLLLNTETISLSAQGNYSLVGNSDLSLNVDLQNASEISKFLKIDSLQTQGNLQANVYGTVDSLQADLTFQLDSTRFQSYTASSLSGTANGLLTKTDTLINANIFAGNVSAVGLLLDTVRLQANSNIHSTDLQLIADGKEVKADLTGNVNLGEDLLVRLDDMMLDYKGSDWRLVEPPASIRLGKNEYEINDLKLISGTTGAADSLQVIHADGLVSRTGDQNLDLKLFNIDIPSTLGLFNVRPDMKGNLDLSLYLRGTAETPEMEGGFNVDNAEFSDYAFTEIAGSIQYADKKLGLDAGIVPRDSGLFELTGFIPFNLSLDSMKVVPPTANDSINLAVVADKLPLKIASAFFPMDEVDGHIESNILVNGTMNNPNPIGDLHIINGKARVKQYGIDYRKILAAIHFEKETVRVDTFLIQSKNGNMFADGAIGFNSQFYKGDVQNSDIQIKFDKFHPFNHKYYNMELTGDVGLHGKKDSVYFDGDVNILESLVYLPAVMNLIGSGAPPEIPMPLLITELEQSNQILDSVIYRFRTDSEEAEKLKFNYFDNIQGKVKVYIPRNTWIKNEQMRFEIAGDMEMIKHRSFMELFGTVDVIRGQYDLLGKTFVVNEGTITFQGGDEFNPRLNIVGSYSMRDQSRVENKLTINVTGDLKEPVIRFEMGGEQLTEGDALSYILFGTNMDALASGQEAALGASAGSLATGAAASLISSELTKLLGKTFNVDYIEMRAGSSFENATFVVGKYITNKLFMSYERRFGDFKDERVAEYEVKLEYELFRFLFLQLASSPINNGIDLIFKIDSKTKFDDLR